MYTTNAIEAVNSSLRKVTKKGFFENETAVFKLFYLRITGELAKKWNNAKLRNAIEAVNSSLRKVTKKGFFENETAVFKLFYLRITGELAKKWNNAKLRNWAKVLNQLSCLEQTASRIAKYIK